MSVPCCPTCGRRMTAPRKLPSDAVDTTTMSEADLRAYYHKTAPIEDALFFGHTLNGTLRPALRDRLNALILTNPGRSAFYTDLHAIQDGWRHDREASEHPQREAASIAELSAHLKLGKKAAAAAIQEGETA